MRNARGLPPLGWEPGAARWARDLADACKLFTTSTTPGEVSCHFQDSTRLLQPLGPKLQTAGLAAPEVTTHVCVCACAVATPDYNRMNNSV